ncbi:hypothetical protein COV17_01450 [Candidatus Woesearchaeota archaeon CG10_big_fil_rev_8_21_14_0_10_36_11]|nr:MAG: hypothetical protein COV17_01450 [Candidatus Woesearchaeota archaeon CG10_big_fil_rev_8_21_14_0_10_36_11]
MKKTKQGQIQITFHWIYVAIAGAVILLFFVGVVVKQKAVSDEQLSFEVIQIMESIFTAAEVSESTKNTLDISGLANLPFFFSCENGISEFGIQDQSSRVQNDIDPLFSMKTIQAPRLVLWSLPYKLPFKVIDFLFIIPSNMKFIVLGENDFADEFIDTSHDDNILLNIDVTQVNTLSDINPGMSSHIRLVIFDGNTPPNIIPDSLLFTFPDEKVSAVVFRGDNVQYYQKSGASWIADGQSVPLIIVPGERQAAKYAAVFAGDREMYLCGMQKAFTRLKYLSAIYTAKIAEIVEHYSTKTDTICYSEFTSIGRNNIQEVLHYYSIDVNLCNEGIEVLQPQSCVPLMSTAVTLMAMNNDMQNSNCISVY